MPPSDDYASPVEVSHTFNPVVAAASSSPSTSAPTSNTTPIIVGVSVGVGSLVLLVLVYRIWRCTRPPKVPLPPIGPLAYDRQRQLAGDYAQSELQSPLPITRPRGSAPFSNNAGYGDYSRHASYQTDDSFIPPSPSLMSSQAHLVANLSESDESGEVTRQRRPSFGSTSTMRPNHSRRLRTVSHTGSVRSSRSQRSSHGTIRGPPHARHNRVDIVLPQPLASGLYNNASRQSHTSYSRASSQERRSESREREYLPSRVSTDGPSSSTHEPTLRSDFHGAPAVYPPPVPPLPVGHSAASSAMKVPSTSSASSPYFSDPSSPNSPSPLLSHSAPSPDYGPPPLPPPKDVPPRRSSRSPNHSVSSHDPRQP